MRRLTGDLLQDCSTVDSFCFFLGCPACGRLWKSSPVRFSRAGVAPDSEGKRVIFRALYERERAAARLRAAAEASQCFSRCPICGRLVCDDCFRICDDLDLCADCAERLQVHAEPVLCAERSG